jgi:hypothetical protein
MLATLSLLQCTNTLDTMRVPIGQILLNKSLITPQQLAKCLEKQQSDSKKLGELLIEQNLITPAQLKEALDDQHIQLADVILQKKWLTVAQLQQLEGDCGAGSSSEFSECCLQKQALSAAQLEYAKKEQYWRRKGFWVIGGA